jgi:alkaline phosphatase
MVTLLLFASPLAEAQRAHNVILFLGDAGGLPTLNAGGLYATNKPLGLYLHTMPYVGLSETSALNAWVTDSANGMTALVTGHKTNNAALSVLPSVAGAPPTPLKTILEYAEERGLSTGVITNMPIYDATPAACYSHVEQRSDSASVIAQLFAPRFGDGPDIVIGNGRAEVERILGPQDGGIAGRFAKAKYKFLNAPRELTPDMKRAAALIDGNDFEPIPVVTSAIKSLSRNKKGYFLMVEWDMHTDVLRKGLQHVREMDEMIRQVAKLVGPDTLILFTADHSFGLRLRGGAKSTPYADQLAASGFAQANTPENHLITVEDTHTGEEVIVAAKGPGADQVHGFIPNTRIFEIMMHAFGWQAAK